MLVCTFLIILHVQYSSKVSDAQRLCVSSGLQRAKLSAALQHSTPACTLQTKLWWQWTALFKALVHWYILVHGTTVHVARPALSCVILQIAWPYSPRQDGPHQIVDLGLARTHRTNCNRLQLNIFHFAPSDFGQTLLFCA